MQFERALVPGRLLRRYQRFFADVRLDDGAEVVAHCPNPGSMRTCLEEGGRVWLRPADDPKRRLRWTWELAEVGGARVVINTARANRVVEEALVAGAIPELAGHDRIEREATAGPGTRFDFALHAGRRRTWLEVKSATMDGGGGGVTLFPDSVTARGARHLAELAARRRRGARAVLLFCAARTGTRVVRPADDIDPAYGAALRAAARAGVEVLAYRCDVTLDGITLAARVDVDLR